MLIFSHVNSSGPSTKHLHLHFIQYFRPCNFLSVPRATLYTETDENEKWCSAKTFRHSKRWGAHSRRAVVHENVTRFWLQTLHMQERALEQFSRKEKTKRAAQSRYWAWELVAECWPRGKVTKDERHPWQTDPLDLKINKKQRKQIVSVLRYAEHLVCPIQNMSLQSRLETIRRIMNRCFDQSRIGLSERTEHRLLYGDGNVYYTH